MPYWGSGPIDSDYAFDAIGAYIFLLKQRLFQDAETVIMKSYPEQAIVASVQSLRLLDASFPKCVRVHFQKKDLELAKAKFYEWYGLVEGRLPIDLRDALRAEAEAEFGRYLEQLMTLS